MERLQLALIALVLPAVACDQTASDDATTFRTMPSDSFFDIFMEPAVAKASYKEFSIVKKTDTSSCSLRDKGTVVWDIADYKSAGTTGEEKGGSVWEVLEHHDVDRTGQVELSWDLVDPNSCDVVCTVEPDPMPQTREHVLLARQVGVPHLAETEPQSHTREHILLARQVGNAVLDANGRATHVWDDTDIVHVVTDEVEATTSEDATRSGAMQLVMAAYLRGLCR